MSMKRLYELRHGEYASEEAQLWLDRLTKEVQLPAENHLALLIDHFLQHLEGKSAEMVTFREGYRIQEVLESLIK